MQNNDLNDAKSALNSVLLQQPVKTMMKFELAQVLNMGSVIIR